MFAVNIKRKALRNLEKLNKKQKRRITTKKPRHFLEYTDIPPDEFLARTRKNPKCPEHRS
jgi:mRNA-degrading endonuclease RelE of RelBE toxin-antitoxin system